MGLLQPLTGQHVTPDGSPAGVASPARLHLGPGGQRFRAAHNGLARRERHPAGAGVQIARAQIPAQDPTPVPTWGKVKADYRK